jgi:threonine/homoserine/homoserine lactone efflux protein
MRSFFARWKPKHLIGAWISYWGVLAIAALSPAAIAIWKVTRPGMKGDASLSLGDGGLNLHVTAAGVTTWNRTASVAMVVLAVAGPPLLLWLCWVLSRSSSRNSGSHPPEQLRSADELPLRREDRARDVMR